MSRLRSSRPLRKLMSARLLSLGLCTLLGATAAHAELLVYEGFDYTAGVNTPSSSGTPSTAGVTVNTGTGLTGAWTMNRGFATASNAASSFTTGDALTLSGLSSTASRLQWTGNGSSSGSNYLTASLDTTASNALGNPGTGNSKTIWVSYLFNTTTALTGSGGVYLSKGGLSGDSASSFGAGSNAIGFGWDGLTGKAGASAVNATSGQSAMRGTSTTLSANTSYWMVGSFKITGTSATTANISSINMWVKPTLGYTMPATELALGAASSTYTFGIGYAYTEGLKLAISPGASSSFAFDEIRIGTTFADVAPAASAIPEPSSAAFIAAGACGAFVCLRRRRSTQ